ncbi:hypothetical protein BDN72DRAFT_958786 [Pluteus cervinus]|uniref:Uncharacterized protein n=1 Tax=Pluteus cervinus TaxID=181527 RepID=A0ACD3AXS8_9AGAR|nr:hypothetical protein BDN72DRAFT_958786 [Pluteus cervinus]
MTQRIKLNYYVVFDNTEFGELEIDSSKSIKDVLEEVFQRILTAFEMASSDVLHVIIDTPEFARAFRPNKHFSRLVAEEGSMTKFYRYWRKLTLNDVLRENVLSLAIDERGLHDAAHRWRVGRTDGRILVRESYRALFLRACRLRRFNRRTGVLLTGQPGTGKATWLWFILTCLIASRQTVAFHSGNKTRLFHGGCVYVIDDSPTRFFELSSASIWCLIDVGSQPEPPPIYLVHLANFGGNIFPVQAAYPNAVRYGHWVRQRSARMWGMPLWDDEELMQGLQLDTRYNNVLNALIQSSGSIEECTRRYCGLQELVAYYQASSGDLAERVKSSFQSLLKQLIPEYGGIPFDLYNAIFSPQVMGQPIKLALESISLIDLPTTIRSMIPEYSRSDFTSPSHRLVSLDVTKSSVNVDRFEVKFRSPRIRAQVIEKAVLLRPADARPLIDEYWWFSDLPSFRWIFEAFAYRVLSGVDPGHVLRPLIPMHIEGPPNNPIFSTSWSVSHLTSSQVFLPTPRLYYTPVSFTKQKDATWDLEWPPRGDDSLILEDCFCVPEVSDNTLFDAFFVEFKRRKRSVTPIVWMFRTNLSEPQEGFNEGYALVHSIKAAAIERVGVFVKDERKVTEPELKYVLVSHSTLPRAWRMPEDWVESVQGEVYYQTVTLDDYDGVGSISASTKPIVVTGSKRKRCQTLDHLQDDLPIT